MAEVAVHTGKTQLARQAPHHRHARMQCPDPLPAYVQALFAEFRAAK